MRKSRMKYQNENCYYHLMNQACGWKEDRIFGNEEKEYMVMLIRWLTKYYTVEIISFTFMANHWHVICWAPGVRLKPKDVVKRYNRFYKNKKAPLKVELEAKCRHEAERMRDISCFISDFQQRFTRWFNKRHKRRGRLWADRFNSTILQEGNALWNCVKYVELNCVRAGIVDDPADYRFCSWGIWNGSGRHPFFSNFHRHLKCSLGEIAKNWTVKDLEAELRSEMARIISGEQGNDSETIKEDMQKARKKPPFILQMDRRVRYWSDGAIIGSKLFIENVTSHFYGEVKAKKKCLDKLLDLSKNDMPMICHKCKRDNFNSIIFCQPSN